jgi:hypothetical protein
MASAVDGSPAIGGTNGEARVAKPHVNSSIAADHGAETGHDVQPGDGDDASPAAVGSPNSATTPPYGRSPNMHQRNISNISTESALPAGAIRLRDNETSDHSDRNRACWAKSVEITGHTVVNGSATNIGAFVVWIIKVETLSVGIAQVLLLSRRC